jgi:hypothetical protein
VNFSQIFSTNSLSLRCTCAIICGIVNGDAAQVTMHHDQLPAAARQNRLTT